MGSTRWPSRALWLVLVAFGVSLLPGASAGAAAPPSQTIDLIPVTGTIDPQTATYLRDRIAGASDDGVQAIVIQLDTPGGVDVSVRDLTGAILESDVPVIVWIAPRGAEAASAGTYLAYASSLIFMADGSTIGPAVPVSLAHGGELSAGERDAAAAYLQELGARTQHDTDWALSSVVDGDSLTGVDATAQGVADGPASSLGELLQGLDGRSVKTSAGAHVTFETWDEGRGTPSVAVRFQEMNLWQRLLHSVTDPDVAYLLLLIGLFGIIFELYNPGIGLAAIIGVGALALSFYALSVLPTDWLGALIVVAAVVLLVIDLHTSGLGGWTVGGLVGLVVGGLVLFSGSSVRVSVWTIAAGVIGSLIFFISVMTAALRVRLRRPITGEEGLIGAIGEAKTDIAPEGTVITKGTLWRARTMETGIAAGEKVEVKATEGLVLLVEPLHDHEKVD
ncbi:MAG TPA: NfeD family protein [Actinomycetota bacterium]|nr:NfeD family protein [Actinomycetota bacterium]